MNLKMLKVIMIGGSPMCGKSTAAMRIASSLRWQCLSTDDIGEILQTVTDINPMRGQIHTEYYANTPKEKLIWDIMEYHKQLRPAIMRIIDIHSTWGNPIVLEGWALYPVNVALLLSNDIKAVWLIAENGLLKKRYDQNPGFSEKSGNPQQMKENYLHRSQWHNEILLEQCLQYGQPHIFVHDNMTSDEIADKINQTLAINHEYV